MRVCERQKKEVRTCAPQLLGKSYVLSSRSAQLYSRKHVLYLLVIGGLLESFETYEYVRVSRTDDR